MTGPGGGEAERFEDRSQQKESSPDYYALLNEAIRDRDFKQAQIIQRLRPNLSPQIEVAQAVYDTMLVEWQNGGNNSQDLAYLSSICGPTLDQSVAIRVSLEQFDDATNTSKMLRRLTNLQEATKFVIPPEIVQEKYQSLLEKYNYQTYLIADEISMIRQFTGIAPSHQLIQGLYASGELKIAQRVAKALDIEVTEQMAQEGFSEALRKGVVINAQWILDNDFVPPEEYVQAAYRVIFKTVAQNLNEWIRKAKELEARTKIQPHFQESDIRHTFQVYLDMGWYGKEGYRGIEEALQYFGRPLYFDQAYQKLLKVIRAEVEQGVFQQHNKKNVSEQQTILSKLAGKELQVANSDIQDAYTYAIESNNSAGVLSIFEAFGVRPEIAAESAQEFMSRHAVRRNSTIITELEKVFGLQFKISDKALLAKYQKALAEFDFEAVETLQKVSGKSPDQEEIYQAVADYARKLLTDSLSSGLNNSGWQRIIIKICETFDVTFSIPDSEKLYAVCFSDSGFISVKNLRAIYEISHHFLSPELAQRAYLSFISQTKYLFEAGTYFYEVYELSNRHRPLFNQAELQKFYLAFVQDGLSRSGIDKAGLQKIIDITGIKADFSMADFRQFMLQAIKLGRLKSMKTIEEIFGFELVMDDEMVSIIHSVVTAELEGLANESTVSVSFRMGSSQIAQLIQLSGKALDPNFVRQLFERILLSGEDNCLTQAKNVSNATNTKLELSPEICNLVARKLLLQGKTKVLEEFAQSFSFVLEDSAVWASYDQILSEETSENLTSQRQSSWFVRLKRVIQATRVTPTRLQVDLIIKKLMPDESWRRDSRNFYLDTYLSLRENLGIESEELKTRALIHLVKAEAYIQIAKLKENGVSVQDLPEALIVAEGETLLAAGMIDQLEKMVKYLELKYLPMTEVSVLQAYRKLVADPEFGRDRSNGVTEKFHKLFKLTQLTPDFDSEEISQIYRVILKRNYQRDVAWFQEACGTPPTDQDYISLVGYLLTSNRVSESELKRLTDLYQLEVPQTVIDRCMIINLEKTEKISDYLTLEQTVSSVFGVLPQIPVVVMDEQVKRLLISSSKDSVSSSALTLFEWYSKRVGKNPPSELISLAFALCFGKYIFDPRFKLTPSQSRGSGAEYMSYWDWLESQYGPPSNTTVQLAYLNEAVREFNWDLASDWAKIYEFSDIPPSFEQMVSHAQTMNLEITMSDLKERLQAFCRDRLLKSDIESVKKLEQLTGEKLTFQQSDLQTLYLDVLMGEVEDKSRLFQYLYDSTQILPHSDIIQALIRENIDSLLNLQLIFGDSHEMFVIVLSRSPLVLKSVVNLFDITSFDELNAFSIEHVGFLKFAYGNEGSSIDLDEVDIQALTHLPISLIEAVQAKRQGIAIVTLDSEEDYKKLFNGLKLSSHDWEPSNIDWAKFERMCQRFGYEEIFGRSATLVGWDTEHNYYTDLQNSRYMIIDQLSCFENFPAITLEEIDWALGKSQGVEGRFADSVRAVSEALPNDFPQQKVWETVLKPIVHSQGVGSFLYLDEIKSLLTIEFTDVGESEIRTKPIQSLNDLEFLGMMANRYGSQAWDYIRSFLVPGLKQRIIQSPISQEAAMLTSFSEDVPYQVLEIYVEYREIERKWGKSAHWKKAQEIEKLREGFRLVLDSIRDGSSNEDAESYPNFYRAMFYSFPPALTMTEDQYRRLYEERSGRQSDLNPDLLRSAVRSKQVRIATGGYVLKDNQRVDMARIAEFGTLVNRSKTELASFEEKEIPDLGELLTTTWIEGTYLENKQKIILQLCRWYQSTGKLLRIDPDLESLSSIYEYVSDTTPDLIAEAINVFKQVHPDSFDALASRKKVASVRNPRVLSKRINEIMQLKLSADERKLKLESILRTIGVSDPDSVSTQLITTTNLGEISEVVNELAGTPEPFTIARLISDKIYSQERSNIAAEIGKYQFVGEELADNGETLTLEVSKARTHSLVGFNMGVCVTTDEQLWNNPNFSNMIIWDEHNIAQGGMHFLVIENEGKKYLSLPGINPSQKLLSRLDPERIYTALITYAKEVAAAQGLEPTILIPVTSVIHSNRAEIQSIVSSKRYRVLNLDHNQEFSYSPYSYSFSSCFQVK